MWYVCLFVLPLLFLTGCVGPIALEKVLPAYDESIRKLQIDGILTNIARNSHELPSHFMRTTTIAATFDFTTNTSISADIPTGAAAAGLGQIIPTLSTSASENPTIGIEPVHGKEYSERMLTPFSNTTFMMLAKQGSPLDMVIRLMARGFEFQNADGSPNKFIRNSPDSPREYERFRRIALHLASLYATNQLFLDQIVFDKYESLRLTGPPSAKDILDASKSGYQYKAVAGAPEEYQLSKRVIGSVALTNYSPRTMNNTARARLNSIAESNPNNYVQVDIRPGYPGGDFPIFGAISLRSLNEIFWFIALGIEKEPECEVDIDPRTTTLNLKTSDVSPNPDRTLTIVESESLPTDVKELSIQYRESYYYVANTRWDREAFNVLYLLTHVTTQEVPQRMGFPIAITK